MKKRLLQTAALLFAASGFAPQAYADTDILKAEQGYLRITKMPTAEELANYYFIIVDKDQDLMMTRGAGSQNIQGSGNRTWWYMNSADPTMDLSRVWLIEANNANGASNGYSFSSVLEPDLYMQTESGSGNFYFHTHDNGGGVASWYQFLFKYDATEDSWTFQNASHENSYLGAEKNEGAAAGVEAAANRGAWGIVGEFVIYAITKQDFYQAKITNVYESLLDYSVADGEAKAKYQAAIATAKTAMEEAGNNVEGLDAALAELESACQDYAKAAMPANGKALDVSFLMKDAAVTGTASDWNGSAYVNNQQQYVGAPDDVFLNGGGLQTITGLRQTITGLRAGVYRLTAATRAQNANGASIALNGATATIGNVGDTGNALCNGWGWTTTSSVVVEEGGSLDISFSATNGWANADNFKLEYLGQMVENVSLTVSEAGWATLMLPYAAETLPEGLKAYACSSVDEDNVLVLNGAESLAAHTPYIIQATPETYTFEGSGMIDGTLHTVGALTGTYVSMDAVVGSYVLQNQTDGDGIGFYKVEDGQQPTVGAFRAYLNPEVVSNNANVLKMVFDGNVTGIGNTVVEEADATVDVYSLSGILVRKGVAKDEALSGLQKGIYVVDGVKKAVK